MQLEENAGAPFLTQHYRVKGGSHEFLFHQLAKNQKRMLK